MLSLKKALEGVTFRGEFVLVAGQFAFRAADLASVQCLHRSSSDEEKGTATLQVVAGESRFNITVQHTGVYKRRPVTVHALVERIVFAAAACIAEQTSVPVLQIRVLDGKRILIPADEVKTLVLSEPNAEGLVTVEIYKRCELNVFAMAELPEEEALHLFNLVAEVQTHRN